MLRLVFQKLLKNRWMFISLLTGFLVLATVVGCVPMFTNAVLKRVFIQDLQQEQARYNQYPGLYRITMDFNFKSYDNGLAFRYFDNMISDSSIDRTGIPKLVDTVRLTMENRIYSPAPYVGMATKQYIDVVAIDGMDDKVVAKFGRMNKPGIVDGAYEFVVSEYTMKKLRLSIGSEYLVTYPYDVDALFKSDDMQQCMRMRLVGVVSAKDINDPFWFFDMTTYTSTFFMDFDTMVADYSESTMVTNAVWYKAFDYTKLEINHIQNFIDALNTEEARLLQINPATTVYMPTVGVMQEYIRRQESLQITLWVLILPLLILLLFYTFMVAGMKLQNEANEIAVLKSRGASRGQIFGSYIAEWGVISAICLALGPFLSYLVCYFLGASNGFLDFVSRTALPVKLQGMSYVYIAVAMAVLAIAMLIPAFKASKLSIVEHKQAKSAYKKPLWRKTGIDFVLIGLSVYGLYRYQDILEALSSGGDTVTSMGIDPLMFMITAAFMLGTGLFVLRIYPLIIRLIFTAGKKRWSPAAYSSFLRISRSESRESFVMLFIIFSIAIGVFFANSARTVNTNLTDRAEYAAGPDVEVTYDNDYLGALPDCEKFAEEYECVESAADVIRTDTKECASLSLKSKTTKLGAFTLLGIEPYSFGNTVSLRGDLLPYHINEYLNLINGEKNAVLLSSDYMNDKGLSTGDVVTINTDEASISFVVYAFVDYWPGMQTFHYDDKGERQTDSFAIVNSSTLATYFTDISENSHYLWIKRAEDSTIQDFYDAMSFLKVKDMTPEQSALIESKSSVYDTGSLAAKKLRFASQDIVKIKNDPTVQGFNGMLSLVFLVTMAVTTIGFLIYWVISLRGRTLQFGICRAIGMSEKNVMKMIGIEQALITLCSVGIGLFIGDLTSLLYIKLFEMVYAARERTLPFLVYHQTSDYLKIYIVIAIMLCIGAAVLKKVISSIRIDQALKLGED